MNKVQYFVTKLMIVAICISEFLQQHGMWEGNAPL